MPDIDGRQLMLREFASIGADQSLGDAMQLLLETQKDALRPNVVAVIDVDGVFEGMLTARLLERSLLALWMPDQALREDPEQHEKQLLDVVQERLQLRVHDALIRGLPSAAPDARLLDLIVIGCDQKLEFIPVVEDRRIVGVVPITSVFQAAASLALLPDDEGIRFD